MSFLESDTYTYTYTLHVTQTTIQILFVLNLPVRCQNGKNAKREIQSNGTFEHGNTELHDRVEKKVHLDC